MKTKEITTPRSRKSIGRSLLFLLGFLAFSHLLAAFPQLTIPFPGTNLFDGTFHQPRLPDVYRVNPVILLAWGGTPSSGYTWTRSTGSTFPAGTTVDALTGTFHILPGGTLVSGPHNFDMTVSDGSTTTHAAFSFNVEEVNGSPPAVTPFEQLNLSTFALPDARAGVGYGASLYADGESPTYHNWQVVSGALPSGMFLDQARGVVRGTPFTNAVGSYSFQVDVVDGTNTHALNPLNLHYTFNVSLNTSPTPTATPAVTTNPATNVAGNSATVNGSVNPHGLTTSVYFQYGTTTSYGLTTAPQSQGRNTLRNVSAGSSNLSASTVYHFRIVATNSAGTTFGSDRTFTTP
jgi:hypothetical protein